MNGYILESRKILDSDIWSMPPLYFKVWHFLLLKAEYRDNGNLKRGQLLTTIKEIQEECSYNIGYRHIVPDRKQIWKILEWLRTTHESDNESDTKGTTKATMIATTKATGGILVNICNYNKYQAQIKHERDNKSDNEEHNESDTKGTTKATLHYNKKEKNKKLNNNSARAHERNQIPPTVDMVRAYCDKRKNGIDAEYFVDYYRTRDWILSNGKKMKDWHSAVRTWEHNEKERNPEKVSKDDLQDRLNDAIAEKRELESKLQDATDDERETLILNIERCKETISRLKAKV